MGVQLQSPLEGMFKYVSLGHNDAGNRTSGGLRVKPIPKPYI